MSLRFKIGVHTEAESNTEDLASDSAEDQKACIVDTVDLRMVALEDTNHVIGPCCDGGDDDETDDAGEDTEDVEDSWDRQNAQTDLGLHHESNSADPADLLTLVKLKVLMMLRMTYSAVVGTFISDITKDIIVNLRFASDRRRVVQSRLIILVIMLEVLLSRTARVL